MEQIDWTAESNEDIQHDLALTLADIFSLYDTAWIEREMDCAESMRRELVRRGAALPVACAFIYSPYARGKRELVYRLEAA